MITPFSLATSLWKPANWFGKESFDAADLAFPGLEERSFIVVCAVLLQVFRSEGLTSDSELQFGYIRDDMRRAIGRKKYFCLWISKGGIKCECLPGAGALLPRLKSCCVV